MIIPGRITPSRNASFCSIQFDITEYLSKFKALRTAAENDQINISSGRPFDVSKKPLAQLQKPSSNSL